VTTPELLRDVLPAVSRSFALSLRVLPAPLRGPFGVTYLVARTADTLADTAARPPAERASALRAVRAALQDDAASAVPAPGSLEAALPAGERVLLARWPEVLRAYRALAPGDRARARTVLLVLTAGMTEALERFPPETAGRIEALRTRAELDRYTFMNAGCVGEFWTDMLVAHRRACRRWDVARQRARGIRFGQGLQLVNVLRDLPRDLRTGRCYLPREDLAALGVTPEDLLDPGALGRVRPLVLALLDQAHAGLEEGRRYTLTVPRREGRLRLACAWPLLIGLATLARLRRADDLLDPAVVVKVPRPEVRRLLRGSLLRVWSNGLLTAYARDLAGVGPAP
jgi:farnesyl-diphosphate farnesyltransferase